MKIFVSYAYRDKILVDDLRRHLLPLQQQGLVEIWQDSEIAPGGEWNKVIDKYLNTADIILLMLSPDFLASDYCYSVEIQHALERHRRGEARVIPVILRSVHWQDAPFSMLKVLPTDAKPVTTWLNRDEAFYNIVSEITNVIKEDIAHPGKSEGKLQNKPGLPTPPSVNLPTSPTTLQLCPVCSYENPVSSHFCFRCGSEILAPVFSGVQNAIVPTQQPSPQLIAFMGTRSTSSTKGFFSLRRAFAGYGVPVTHHSWLLNGDSLLAGNVASAIMEIFSQRNITGLKLSYNNLREHGLETEERRYLMVQRNMITVFIYVAPTGRDLYISRTTLIRLPIDLLRVAFLGALAGALFLPSILYTFISGLRTYSLFPLLVPALILLYLLWMLLRSFKYWVIEKDFWIYLRTRDLNHFQFDDIMLLEHATDESVSIAVKQVGLDASKISTPAHGYQPQHRIRII